MKNPLDITSRQNVRVKEAAKLRSARQRAKQGRILIDGAREIIRALDMGVEILEAFVCDSLCRSPDAQNAVGRLADAQVAHVTPEVFEKLSFGGRADGIVVVAKTPERQLDQLPLSPKALVAVLEGLEKPGNVGAILRSADGAGLDGVIVADGRTDLLNPNTIRASLGTVFNPNVCAASTQQTLAWLQKSNLPIVAARPDATLPYHEFDFRNGAAIVLGSEADGLSEHWNGTKITQVKLPMLGRADSLNVSATAAVLFYEARRQRDRVFHISDQTSPRAAAKVLSSSMVRVSGPTPPGTGVM